ncbi:MAG: SagB/ThcOx family dehydrogenase [Planctomycetota bacterium]
MRPPDLEQGRFFLKDTVRLLVDFSQTEQQRGLPPPPLQKSYAPDARRIPLPSPEEWQGIAPLALQRAIGERASRRRYTERPLKLDELAFLLWATQGVRSQVDEGTALRTVPSAGCRHAFETHLAVMRVEGLEQGVYRYLPLGHELLFEFAEQRLPGALTEATLGQNFVGAAAAVFCWTAVPARMEWRYGAAAHKVIALDAGHICQNLYLACEAIGAGCCAVAAYHQEFFDRLLRVDGNEEFTVYLAPVGKV